MTDNADPVVPVLLTVARFARDASLSTVTVRRLVRLGTIRSTRIGRALRIPTSEIARLATLSNAATR